MVSSFIHETSDYIIDSALEKPCGKVQKDDKTQIRYNRSSDQLEVLGLIPGADAHLNIYNMSRC